MKVTNFILVLFFLISCKNSFKETNQSVKIDTLVYSYKGFNNGGSLELLSNGNFIQTKYVFGCTGGGEIKKIFGVYSKDSSNVILQEKSINLELLPIEFEGKSKIINLNIVPDSLKLSSNFKIIRWNNFEYLLSEKITEGWSLRELNDFHRFSENYNSGYEPEDSGMYLRMRMKNSKTEDKLNIEQIPIKWRELFLEKPLKTRIMGFSKKTEIIEDEIYIYWLIEIDKGKNQKVRRFLDFKRKDEYNLFTVDSVLENKSFIKVYDHSFPNKMDLKVGEELRSKW